jgi:chromosome segregation ATPase
MQAMGVAFSASLFGVLGSLIMGALMVAVRSASSDLVALVQSGTSLMLDITNEDSNALPDLETVTEALGALAEHSPLLRGLSVALDQSERRVRELMTGMGTLMASMETSSNATELLVERMQQQTEQQELTMSLLLALQNNMGLLAEQQTTLTETSARTTDVLERQQAQLLATLKDQRETNNAQLQAQQALWQEQSKVQRDLLSHQAEVFEKLMLSEHLHRKQALETFSASQTESLQNMTEHLFSTQRMMNEHATHTELLMTSLSEAQEQTVHANLERNRLLAESSKTLQADNHSRTQLVTRLESLLTETQSRNEQIIHMLSTRFDGHAA